MDSAPSSTSSSAVPPAPSPPDAGRMAAKFMAALAREARAGVAAVDHYIASFCRTLAGGPLGAPAAPPTDGQVKVDVTLDGARQWEAAFTTGDACVLTMLQWDIGETAPGPAGETEVVVDFPSFELSSPFTAFTDYGTPSWHNIGGHPCRLAGSTPQLVQAYTAHRVAAALEDAGFAASVELVDVTLPAGGRLVVVVDGTEADLRGPEWETGARCVVGRVAGPRAAGVLAHLRALARAHASWYSGGPTGGQPGEKRPGEEQPGGGQGGAGAGP